MIEHKAFSFATKAVAEDGSFSGYASTFGNEDHGGDVVAKGAFAESINQSKGIVPILFGHDSAKPIGWNTFAEEDSKGLAVRGQLLVKDPLAQKAREFMQLGLKVGGRVGLSIGYRVPNGGSEKRSGVRWLTKIQLVEYIRSSHFQ